MIKNDNIQYVNALKRNQVLSCIDIVKKHPQVTRLIVFGSAVTNHCDENSDIDICLDINGSTRGRDMYELSRDICWACDHNCDILTYNKLNAAFKNEVDG